MAACRADFIVVIMLEIDKEKIIKIPFSSELYPKEWKDLPDAPSELFAYGNVELLKERKFVIVGSRRTPQSSLKLGEKIAKTLSEHFVIVTGSADGGDTSAIEGALPFGKVICLLAGGFSALPQGNFSLLERIAKKGLLLSPHPFETEVRAFSYGYRNKLLAALGEGTLVLAAGEKSGTLITAKFAQKFGKFVFAIPYPPCSEVGAGCNALIKKGAFLTETAEDIASRFKISLREDKKIELTGLEFAVYEALKERGEAHASELSAVTKIPVFKMSAILSALEVKGVAVPLGGNRYSKV